jgi:hypothetical protein
LKPEKEGSGSRPNSDRVRGENFSFEKESRCEENLSGNGKQVQSEV